MSPTVATPVERAPELPRLARQGCVGLDVAAHKRAVYRYLEVEGGLAGWLRANEATRRTFGPYFARHVARARARAKLPAGQAIDRALYLVLRKAGAYDAFADALLERHLAAHPVALLCHPHALGYRSSVCQRLHPTAGLPGNWAIDFCAEPGTLVVAVEAAKVVKLSGHDPSSGDVDPRSGVFGWSIHYATAKGYRWFSTHYGTRRVELGEPLEAGAILGTVGRWPNDPGRSHTHLGVTSPFGERDARRRVELVAAGPRVRGIVS